MISEASKVEVVVFGERQKKKRQWIVRVRKNKRFDVYKGMMMI
jgi:hypothetical protein